MNAHKPSLEIIGKWVQVPCGPAAVKDEFAASRVICNATAWHTMWEGALNVDA